MVSEPMRISTIRNNGKRRREVKKLRERVIREAVAMRDLVKSRADMQRLDRQLATKGGARG